MTCHDARELFSAEIDGALEGGEAAGLQAHLAGCPECRRELARFRATVAVLRINLPYRIHFRAALLAAGVRLSR